MSGDEWPPPEARVRGALWEAAGELERREYFAAARTLERVRNHGGELVCGLRHLAAAGFKAHEGDPARARRQLEHARRRLAPFLRTDEDVDVAHLLEVVERELSS